MQILQQEHLVKYWATVTLMWWINCIRRTISIMAQVGTVIVKDWEEINISGLLHLRVINNFLRPVKKFALSF